MSTLLLELESAVDAADGLPPVAADLDVLWERVLIRKGGKLIRPSCGKCRY